MSRVGLYQGLERIASALADLSFKQRQSDACPYNKYTCMILGRLAFMGELCRRPAIT